MTLQDFFHQSISPVCPMPAHFSYSTQLLMESFVSRILVLKSCFFSCFLHVSNFESFIWLFRSVSSCCGCSDRSMMCAELENTSSHGMVQSPHLYAQFLFTFCCPLSLSCARMMSWLCPNRTFTLNVSKYIFQIQVLNVHFYPRFMIACFFLISSWLTFLIPTALLAFFSMEIMLLVKYHYFPQGNTKLGRAASVFCYWVLIFCIRFLFQFKITGSRDQPITLDYDA